MAAVFVEYQHKRAAQTTYGKGYITFDGYGFVGIGEDYQSKSPVYVAALFGREFR
jgi:hypothetical protein